MTGLISIMKIETCELHLVKLPRRREHRWAGLTEAIGGYLLVRLTAGGVEGWGEAPVLKDWGGDYGRYYGETPATTVHIIRDLLAPALLGADALNAAAAHALMDGAVKGFPYAKAACDLALYDLAGRALGVPVATLLGGIVRDRIPVAHSLGLMDIDEAVGEAVQVVGEGIRAIKLKVGVDPARDIALVRRIREAVGDGVSLAVDANGGYASPKMALAVLREMEPYRLAYAEQPVAGMEGLAHVARATEIPVMADESCWRPEDALAIARTGAADYISIYTTKPGGLWRAMQVAAVAAAAGLPCNVNGSVETGVGNAANLHLAAAAAPVTLPCVVPVSTPAGSRPGAVAGRYYTDDLIQEPYALVGGSVLLPLGPGWGTTVDMEKVAGYRVGDVVRIEGKR